MKKQLKIWMLLFLCGMALHASAQHGQKITHFYIIGVDGLSAAGLAAAETPNFDRMIADGVLCPQVRSVQISSSSPNWASMIMGAGPEIHGILTNQWEIDSHDLEPVVIDRWGYFPTVLSVLKAQMPDAKAGIIYHWSGFGRLFEPGLASYDANFKTPDETARSMADYIVRERPTFIFSQFDHVDAAGHRSGHMTQGYFDAITHMDSLAGVVMQAVERAGIADETILMVVSDHGGYRFSHGGTNWNEVTPPFILYGPGVKKGALAHGVYMYDVAPTVIDAFGLRAPYAWRGKAIRHAFEGYDLPADPLPLKRNVAAPQINGPRPLFGEPGGVVPTPRTTVKIAPSEPGAAVYYTLDGSLPSEKSIRYTGPFELDKTTVVKAKSFASDAESLLETAFFRFFDPADATLGLNVSFYTGDGWKKIPDFDKLIPVATWRNREIDLDRERIEPLLPKSNSFGVVLTGKLRIDTSGEYTFQLRSDDGSRLWIDGARVVDNDGVRGLAEKKGIVKLDAGLHGIRVEYINTDKRYVLDALYEGPQLPRQIIPAEKFSAK